ncbi:hypothetical protein MKW98_013445, partial [Papaver atlanticum]
ELENGTTRFELSHPTFCETINNKFRVQICGIDIIFFFVSISQTIYRQKGHIYWNTISLQLKRNKFDTLRGTQHYPQYLLSSKL